MEKISERERLLKKELKGIVKILKEKYQPEKIILFGSLANGNVGEWSDIDLVVVKETEEKFIKRLKEVALMTRPKVGVDFLVYTPTEFKRMQERMNYFVLDEVIGRGKVIYDRQNS